MKRITLLYSVIVHEPRDWGDGLMELRPCEEMPEQLAVEGITSDGRQCQAITAREVQCPKPAAVALVVNGQTPVHVCGGHFGVHRRGKVMTLVAE